MWAGPPKRALRAQRAASPVGADLGDDRGDGFGDVRGGGGAAVEGAEGGGEAGVVVAEEAHG